MSHSDKEDSRGNDDEVQSSGEPDEHEASSSAGSRSKLIPCGGAPTWRSAARPCSGTMNGDGRARPRKETAANRLPMLDNYSGSSSETDDECYIYMYKGNGSARQREQSDQERSGVSSPEMDYLEMDFDPEQSNGHEYSDESDNCDMNDVNCHPANDADEEDDSGGHARSSDYAEDEVAMDVVTSNEDIGQQQPEGSGVNFQPLPGTSSSIDSSIPTLAALARDASHKFMRDWEEEIKIDCRASLPIDSSQVDDHKSGGRSAFAQVTPCALVMIKNEPEVEKNQFSSNCLPSGAAAALNTFVALGVTFDRTAVVRMFESPIKPDNCSLAEYLLWRSRKDITHHDIYKALLLISHRNLVCRFFPTFPRRQFNLCSWLLEWIEKGAVPIVTYNPQNGFPMEETLPDVWCHRMVRGVGPGEVHLTDPFQSMSESILSSRLSSSSVLLIKSEEVVSKWEPETDLTPLLSFHNKAWKSLNVLGQIVNAIREEMGGHKTTGFIQIPTTVVSGITLVMTVDNPFASFMTEAPELQLMGGAELQTGSSSSCSASH